MFEVKTYDINSALPLCSFNVMCRPQMFSLGSTITKSADILQQIADQNLVNRAVNAVELIETATNQATQMMTQTAVATNNTFARANDLLTQLEQRDLINVISDASKSLGIASDNVNDLAVRANGLWNDLTSTTTNPDLLDEAKWIMPAMGVRIGIQIYHFFKATSWFDRALAIIQIFLDFFIDFKMLRTIRDFVFTSFGHVPAPSQVVEGEKRVKAQAGGLEVDGITSFFSSLVAIAGTVTVGCIPDKNVFANAMTHFSKKMDVMSRIWRGTQAIQNMFKFVVTTLQDLISYFMDYFLPGGVSSMTLEKECAGIHDWAKRVFEMGLEEQMTRYSWDEKHRQELFKLKDQGDEYYQKLSKLRKPNPVAMTMFHKNMDRCIKLCEQVHRVKMNIPFRIDPFCIWLDGPPGCSKSYCMMDLINACASDSGAPRYNRFYARNLAEAFWSRYTGQFGVGLDDMGASKNSIRSDPWGEFMIMKSNNPFMVQMAELTDKGTQFSSKMIVASSNMAYPHPTEITNVPALWRRRNILAKFETSLTPDEVAAQAGTMDHLKIVLLDPMNPGQVLRRFEKYEDFVMYVRVAFQFYMSRQEALVELNTSLEDKRKPLDPVLLSPSSFKAFMANKELQDRHEEVLLPNAQLQRIDPYLDQNGNVRPKYGTFGEYPVKPQALFRGKDPQARTMPLGAYHRHMPIGDICCFASKVKYEDYTPKNTFADQRLALFFKWYTNLNLMLQEDRLKLRADSEGKYQELHIRRQDRWAQPRWAPDTDSWGYHSFFRSSWVATDLADLLFIPPAFIDELLRNTIQDCKVHVWFKNLSTDIQYCIPAIFSFFRDNVWDILDSRFASKLHEIVPPQFIDVGSGWPQLWARYPLNTDHLLPTTITCDLFPNSLGLLKHRIATPDIDMRTVFELAHGGHHYTRSMQCYWECTTYEDEFGYDWCTDNFHVDIPPLFEIAKHAILRVRMEHLPRDNAYENMLPTTKIFCCPECVDKIDPKETHPAYTNFYGTKTWSGDIKENCRLLQDLANSQGIKILPSIMESMSQGWKSLLPEKRVKPQGTLEIFGGIALAAVAGYGLKTKREWDFLLNRVKRLKNSYPEKWKNRLELVYDPMDILEVDRGDYIHYGIAWERNLILHLQSNGYPGQAKIVATSLEEFSQNQPLRVHNFKEMTDKWDLIQREDHQFKILATHLLNKSVYYSLDKCNCEHFATYMRYGKGFSLQAQMLVGLEEVRDVTHIISKHKAVHPQMYSAAKTSSISGSLADMTIKSDDDKTSLPSLESIGHVGITHQKFDLSGNVEYHPNNLLETGSNTLCKFISNDEPLAPVGYEMIVSHWLQEMSNVGHMSKSDAERNAIMWCENFIKYVKSDKQADEDYELFLDTVNCIGYYMDCIGQGTFSVTLARAIIKFLKPRTEEQLPTYVSYWKRAVTIFSKEVKQFNKDHPYIMKSLIALAIAGSLFGAYSIYQYCTSKSDPPMLTECLALVPTSQEVDPMRAQKYHAGEPRHSAPKAQRVVVGRPQAADQKLKHLTSADGKLARNLFMATHHNARKNQVNVLNVCGRLCIMNYHFANEIADGDMVSLVNAKGIGFVEEWDRSKLVRFGKDENRTDLCMYEMGPQFPSGKNIVDKFVKMQTLQHFNKKDARYFGLDEDLRTILIHGRAHAIDHLRDWDYTIPENRPARPSDEQKTYIREGWLVNVSTDDGFCGAPLLAEGLSTPDQIIGIHAALDQDTGTAISVLTTYEMISGMIKMFGEQLNDNWEDFKCETLLIEKEVDPQALKGNFTYEGRFKIDVSQPSKTKIRKSPIFGVFPPTTEPAVLQPNDPRLDPEYRGKDLLARELEKYGDIQLPLPRKELRIAADAVEQDLLNMKCDFSPRVLTVDEAINGIPEIPHCDRMEMGTSPGFPYIKERKPHEAGKRFLFENTGTEQEPHYVISSDTLRHNLKRRTEEAGKGNLVFSLWHNCLKDERRKTEKIKIGKTRAFCAAPLDYQILVRQFFLMFCACFISNHVDIFSSLGINVDGPAWTRLYRKLRSKGKNGWDEDFRNYDGSEKALAMWMTCEIINRWYNDGPYNARIRRVLVEEMIHTRSFIGNFVYQKHGGMPSGSALTSIFNTIVHAIYTRCVFLIVMKKYGHPELANMKTFNERVADSSLGDDGVVATDDVILQTFNRVTAAQAYTELGIHCTDARKLEVLGRYEPIESLTFLKRGWKRHPTYPDRMLAPIDVNSIYELCNWVTKTLEPEEQLRMNIEDALKFAYHYGPEFFEKFRKAVTLACSSKNLTYFMSCWEEYDEEWCREWIGDSVRCVN